jgi:hypothetical protein
MFSDDGLDDIQAQAGVFVHSHVAEAHHSLHSHRQIGWKNASGL